jgi:hypothetical protein
MTSRDVTPAAPTSHVSHLGRAECPVPAMPASSRFLALPLHFVYLTFSPSRLRLTSPLFVGRPAPLSLPRFPCCILLRVYFSRHHLRSLS